MSDDLGADTINGLAIGKLRGNSYITGPQLLRVTGETLIVSEVRQYDDGTRQVVETGRFQLHPV